MLQKANMFFILVIFWVTKDLSQAATYKSVTDTSGEPQGGSF